MDKKSSRRYERKEKSKELEVGKHKLYHIYNTKLSITSTGRHFSGMQ
jgi:hypothetical protein